METEYKEIRINRTPVLIYPDKVLIGSHVIEREQLMEIVKAQEELQAIKIQFKWEQYDEHDDSWEALYVSVNDKRWIMAYPIFGTEDMDLIKTKINESKAYWKTFK